MNLISKAFSKDKLRLRWTFSPGSLIWRILYGNSGRIVGECRNVDTKTASFFCVDSKTGKPLWNGILLDDPWWVGLETLCQDIVLFHGYAKPDMPEHQGIEARALDTGALLWKNTDLAFWFVAGKRIYAHRDLYEKRIAYILDPGTGEIQEEVSDSSLLPDKSRYVRENDEVQLPVPLDAVADAKIIGNILESKYPHSIAPASAECLETPEYLVVGFYVSEEHQKTFSSNIVVIRRRDRMILYEQQLGHDHPMPVPDLFFLADNALYFLVEQKTIAALELWKS